MLSTAYFRKNAWKTNPAHIFIQILCFLYQISAANKRKRKMMRKCSHSQRLAACVKAKLDQKFGQVYTCNVG